MLAAGDDGHDWEQLLDDLQSGDATVAEDARWTLLETALPAAAAPCLVKLLSHPNAAVCASAAQALGDLEDPPAEAAPLLLELLSAADEDVQDGAEHALSTIAPCDPESIRRLTALLDDPRSAEHALGVLEQVGCEANEAVDALISALPTSEHPERVMWILGDIGPRAAAAVPALIECLARPGANDRAAAASALGAIGRAAKPAVPALLAALDDDEFFTRIAKELDELWQNAPSSLRDSIRKACDREPGFVRLGIAEALWRIDLHSAALRTVIKVLGDPAPADRRLAIRALLDLGDPEDFAVPMLSQVLAEAPSNVRVEVLSAVARFGRHAAAVVSPVTAALEDAEAEVRLAAVQALGAMGKQAASAEPALRRRFKRDACGVVRAAAAEALWRIAPRKSWVRALTGLLDDRAASVRSAAASCLGAIGWPALAARAALRQLLDDPDLAVRGAARNALDAIEGKRRDDDADDIAEEEGVAHD